jgi:hypothetical protein
MLQNQSWINVEQSKFTKELPLGKKKGVEFRIFVSPYDIPEAVRGYMDRDNNRFVIEFRYILDEPLIKNKIDDKVTMFIGSNSKRIYSIESDIKALNVNQVSLKIISAIESIRHTLPNKQVRNANIDVTKEIVNKNWNSIKKAVATI